MGILRQARRVGCVTAATSMALLGLGAADPAAPRPVDEPRRAEICVGIDEGDIRGHDGRVLQAAVDQVAALGGGTVRIGPGRFEMRNALFLRDHVHVKGTPGQTVLVACEGRETPLACDGDCNERQITLEDPAGFRVGDGVSIQDQACGSGFAVTTATLTAKLDDRTFQISAPLYLDYMVALKATARIAFPVVGGWDVKDTSVEGLTIEGNRSQRARLDGCRGGGIYLFQCEDVAIRHCVVRDYNGDGISFQVSQRVLVEDCACEGNAVLGLHPGSGSQHPMVRRNRSVGNGSDGLYVCWRVKHGVFEDNELRDNGGAGVSIGHKDTDNLFRHNAIVGNRSTGVLFRDESEPMGAHRNVFEENQILDNGPSDGGKATGASITIRGHHRDLVFRKNVIGGSRPSATPGVGILQGEHAEGLRSEDNQFLHVKEPIGTGK